MSEPRYMLEKDMWGIGPWTEEPDRVEWMTAAGLPGLATRGFAGSWCGYAAVPPGHPFHGIPYNGCAAGHKPQDPAKHLGYLRMKREHARTARERQMWALMIRTYGLRHRGDRPMLHWRCTCPTPDRLLSAHGGITYSGACQGEICHTPAPGEPDDVYWFGFDTAHAGDFSPAMDTRFRGLALPESHRPIYRTLAYVQAEVEQLATQLQEHRTYGYHRR